MMTMLFMMAGVGYDIPANIMQHNISNQPVYNHAQLQSTCNSTIAASFKCNLTVTLSNKFQVELFEFQVELFELRVNLFEFWVKKTKTNLYLLYYLSSYLLQVSWNLKIKTRHLSLETQILILKSVKDWVSSLASKLSAYISPVLYSCIEFEKPN